MHGTAINTHSNSETDEEWAYTYSSVYSQFATDDVGIKW